jgi:hypothetical protein
MKLPARRQSKILNLTLDDSYEEPYDYFKDIMLQGIIQMSNAEKEGKSIEVNCAAGINRSCSVIVGYAVLLKGWNVKNAMDYIKFEKNKRYGNRWPTLTNENFVRYLKRMQKEFRTNTLLQ